MSQEPRSYIPQHERQILKLSTKDYWLCIVVGVLAALLYLPTLRYGFVNIDDTWLIRDNMMVQHWSSSNLWAIWFDLSVATRLQLGGEYLPVRDMSVLFDHILYGQWVGGHHLTNIALYGLLCAGLALLSLLWLRSRTLAWMAGLLYAFHPIHVEAVAWLSERKGLLGGVFLVAAALAFHRFATRGKISMLLLTAGFMTLAVWSKALNIAGIGAFAVLLWMFPPHRTRPQHTEQTAEPTQLEATPTDANCSHISAPLTSATLEPDAQDQREVNSSDSGDSGDISDTSNCSDTGDSSEVVVQAEVRWQRLWMGWLCLVVVAGLAFVPVWLVGQRVDMVQAYHGGSFVATLWLMARVHAMYLQQLFLASGYAIAYPLEVAQTDLARGLVGIISVLGIAALAVWGLYQRKTWRMWGFIACWWLIFFAPVSQLLFPLQNYIADRYMLLPSFAFALAVAVVLHYYLGILARNALLVIILLISGLLSFGQMQTWSSSRALYEQALQIHPRWVEGMMQLAHIEAESGSLQRANQLIAQAMQIDPHHPKVALRKSLLLARQNQITAAIEVLENSAQKTHDDQVRANLALLLLQQGHAQRALRWAREAATIRSLRPHNQRVLGVVALRLDLLDEAHQAFRLVLRLEPHNPQNLLNMSAVLMKLNQPQAATHFYRKALQLNKAPKIQP